METGTLWVDALLVAALAGWIALGALENLLRPGVNAEMVTDVLSMRTMHKEFPDIYAIVSVNKIEDPRIHKLVFGAIVLAECATTLLLVAATIGLAGAALHLWDPATMRVVAIAGTLAFTMIWSGFLIGGQWFYYWIAEQPAQHTHFLLAIWGVATLLVLMRV